MIKNSPSCLISQEPYIMWMWVLLLVRKMMISPDVFFILFKTLIFRVVWRVKGQKMTQKDKNFCLSHSISQYPYLIQLCFLLHVSDVDVFNNFSFFSKFWFLGFLGGGVKGQKMAHSYQFQFVTLYISGTADHIIMIFGIQVENHDISRCFSLFF